MGLLLRLYPKQKHSCKSQRKKERKKERKKPPWVGTRTHAGTMVKITKFI
jgi:hypothetical protein